MEIITGVAPAEYGDKSSLVVHIVTKSGLDQPKPTGSVSFGYGSFKSPTADVNVGGGSHTVGNFLSLSGMRTDRFLDPPEFQALHDDGQPVVALRSSRRPRRRDGHVPSQRAGRPLGVRRAEHLRCRRARPGAAPERSTRSTSRRATRRSSARRRCSRPTRFVRQDHLTYTPSADPFADQPARSARTAS